MLKQFGKKINQKYKLFQKSFPYLNIVSILYNFETQVNQSHYIRVVSLASLDKRTTKGTVHVCKHERIHENFTLDSTL